MSMRPRDFYINPETIHESAFVTVLNAGDHWVTLTNFNPFYVDKMNDSGLGIWFMYESLKNHQYYCGLFAVAYAMAICESKEPAKLLFLQIAMRDNFNTTLKTQELKQCTLIF